MTNPTPTALPWEFKKLDAAHATIYDANGMVVVGRMVHAPRENLCNAEFIVRACNHHDALVKALVELRNVFVAGLDRGDDSFDSLLNRVNTLLADMGK